MAIKTSTMKPFQAGDIFLGCTYLCDPDDDHAGEGRILQFSRDLVPKGTLYTQATGQQKIEIEPTSDSTFALTVVDASVVFHRNEDGSVEGATLNQNGQNHATRLPDEEEVPAWEPTNDELAEFAGRYFSEEIETFYHIELGDDGLVVRHRRLDEATLNPGDEDGFSGGGLTYSFERDRNGRVIAFYVSNGRTRDVRFQRVQ